MDDALSLPAVAAFKEKETEGTDQKTLGHYLFLNSSPRSLLSFGKKEKPYLYDLNFSIIYFSILAP
jgi:hypothetical protein